MLLPVRTLGRDEAGGRLASGLDGAGGQAGSAEGSGNGNHFGGGGVWEGRWNWGWNEGAMDEVGVVRENGRSAGKIGRRAHSGAWVLTKAR